jgi:hypothetical protein
MLNIFACQRFSFTYHQLDFVEFFFDIQCLLWESYLFSAQYVFPLLFHFVCYGLVTFRRLAVTLVLMLVL